MSPMVISVLESEMSTGAETETLISVDRSVESETAARLPNPVGSVVTDSQPRGVDSRALGNDSCD